MTCGRMKSGFVSLILVTGLYAGPAWADSLSVQDRDEINRLRAAQGHSAEAIEPLIEQINRAGEKGVPPEPLANKVKEGLAKGVDPKRIEPVLRQLTSHFEAAQDLLREAGTRGAIEGNRQRAMETMAEALARGATVDEVRELARVTQDGKQKVTQDLLATGAKSLAVMKEGKIPAKDGAALVSEGIRQGYRPSELLELSREVKRRGAEFQEGRANLQTLREQISRGERGDRLFREDRSGSGGGDRGGRGDSGRDRLERPDRSGHGDRPDRVERPDRLDRPDRPERPERPDRSGSGRDR
jgi:hypothetical protein